VAQSSSPRTYGDVDSIVVSRGTSDPLLAELVVDERTRDVTLAVRAFGADGNPDVVHHIPLHRLRGDLAKRAFDVAVVGVTAPVWISALGMLALAVKCTSPGPVFYRQDRLGRGGQKFRCVKLRTMRVDADGHLQQLLNANPELRTEFDVRFKLRRDPRVTQFGRVLRKTGLDELPQLFAVLSGDMSLVGPRPIVTKETHYYGSCLVLMQSVRPGLTGLWQVSGRNDIPYPDRVTYDIEYVLTRTLWGDVKLMAKTFALAFHPARRGAY
jgi:lipopolysaccharide/colanic/teichoic acid biosynthesis glycosyltransferase